MDSTNTQQNFSETPHSRHSLSILLGAGIVGLLLIVTAFALTPFTRKQNSTATSTVTNTRQITPTSEPANIAELNNKRRKTDVKTLLNVIWNYAIDSKGAFPSGITSQESRISKGGADLCAVLQQMIESDTPVYVENLPIDPALSQGERTVDCSSNYDTGYTVYEKEGVITVSAPYAELGETISSSL